MSLMRDYDSNMRYVKMQTALFWLSYIIIPIISAIILGVIIASTDLPEMRVQALFLLCAIFSNGIYSFLMLQGAFF